MVIKLSRLVFDRSSNYENYSQVGFRLYDDEIDFVEDLANELGSKSVSGLAKYLLMNARELNLVEADQKMKNKNILYEKIIYETKKIGTNINQIAYQLNTIKEPDKDELKKIEEHLSAIHRYNKLVLDGVNEMREKL